MIKAKLSEPPKDFKYGVMSSDAKQGTMGARAFYFIMYFIYYVVIIMYPNDL